MSDDNAPEGWTIVSIGNDGSILCQKANGQRARYWLHNDHPSGEKYALYGKAERVAYDLEYLRDQLPPQLVKENPQLLLLAIGDLATRAREVAENLLNEQL